ncbi:uncharacterized protein LOC131875158 [Cryptomeria japonica]|uniref:uncharacterized protein LOC131875158 n=1 Tax=Cryptomeria japonica TaxID=3369 RepID=UPI0027DA067E|nr:uncharacterized protein LOC131875158 [Cryptomeria japonica]
MWVKLHGLPMEFWEEDVFARIANTFGELIAIDQITTSRRRLIYARICVGVGPDTNMPEEIEIESKLGKWKQNIIFETIPFAFFHCKKVGHWAKKCPSIEGKTYLKTKVWKKVDKPLKALESNDPDKEKHSQIGWVEEEITSEVGNELKIEMLEPSDKDSEHKERDNIQQEDLEKDKAELVLDKSESKVGQKPLDNKEEGDNFNLVAKSHDPDKELDWLQEAQPDNILGQGLSKISLATLAKAIARVTVGDKPLAEHVKELVVVLHKVEAIECMVGKIMATEQRSMRWEIERKWKSK